MFESPRAGSAKNTPTRSLERKNLLNDSSIQSNKDYAINEFTSLLLPSPLRSERDGQITFQKERNANRDIATNSFKSSSLNRSRVRGRLQPPIRSSNKKTPAGRSSNKKELRRNTSKYLVNSTPTLNRNTSSTQPQGQEKFQSGVSPTLFKDQQSSERSLDYYQSKSNQKVKSIPR